MFSLNGVLYRICTWIYYFAYLNILFLLSCIPIITILPALAGLYGVVRKWVKGDEPPIFPTFYKLFAENFKQSLVAGIIMTVIGAFLAEDLYLLSHIKSSLNYVILICILVVAFNYVVTFMHLFPLMVNNYYSTKQLLVNAFKLGVYKLHISIVILLITGSLAYLTLTHFSFVFVFFFSSISAYITYWFVERKFIAIRASQEAAEENDSTAEDAVK